MTDTDSTPQRILVAAITVIERDGLSAATTRAIAEEAGANIASINYHFRSKTALLEEAMNLSWRHAAEHLDEFLSAEPWDPERALVGIGEFLLEGGYRYPNVTKAHFFGTDGTPLPLTAASVHDLMDRLAARLSAVLRVADGHALKARVEAFVSAIVLPPITPALFERLNAPEARAAYARTAALDLLAAAARPVT